MRLGTIAFLTGILVFQQFPGLPELRWLAVAAIVPAALRWRRLLLPALAVAGFLWAWCDAAQTLSYTLPASLEGKDVWLRGRIVSLPERTGRITRFVFEGQAMERHGEGLPPPPKVRLSWYGEAPPLVAGDRWRLQVRLKRPRGFSNPGGFDYEGWLYRQGIRATGYVRADPGNARLGKATVSLNRIRQDAERRIEAALQDHPSAGLVKALALGVRRDIRPAQWRVLNRTGTSHLLAISGLHVGLVAGMIFFLVRFLWRRSAIALRYWPAPKAAALTAVAAAGLYAALAGFSIPTQRAWILVAVVMVAQLRQRSLAAGNALALALLGVLLWDPQSVLSAGFWLSFAAVAAILFGMGNRPGAPRRWRRWGRVQWLVAVGLVPLTLLYFQRAALVAPVANLIAVPWTSVIVVPLTLAGSLLSVLPGVGEPLLALAAQALQAMWWCLEAFAALPQGVWHAPQPSPGSLAAGVCGAAWLLAPRGVPARWIGAVWLLPIAVWPGPAPTHGEAWFTLLDVGQGLAAVVRTKERVVVYDAGPRFSPSFDTGRAVVVPYLRSAGVHRVDLLIATHGDTDHIGGVASVLANVPVEKVLSGAAKPIGHPVVQPCREGQSWEWDGVRFRMLHPRRSDRSEPNNRSCVLRVSSGAGSVLLTGDIEKDVERRLVREQARWLKATVLVAPHHGSRTSSSAAFLDAVMPRYALFPVGYRNRFGFPRPAIVARYRRRDVKLYDTANHGAITFSLPADGHVDPPRRHRIAAQRYWRAAPPRP